ncbi:hypothetical protein MMC29_001262 [Sticta canariensis]|nr:hypothetical protein [Sticta canariensis]
MAHHKPPFTLETAQEKVKASQASWNSQYVHSPSLIALLPLGILKIPKTFPPVHKPLPLTSFLPPPFVPFDRNPDVTKKGYTEDCIWRNRDHFFRGHAAIVAFLTAKWGCERNYRLRKELFAFRENKIAVQFWYEYQDEQDEMKWKRCYGLEDWTFNEQGKMRKRMMSGNDVVIGEEGRWFRDGVEVDEVEIGEEHW